MLIIVGKSSRSGLGLSSDGHFVDFTSFSPETYCCLRLDHKPAQLLLKFFSIPLLQGVHLYLHTRSVGASDDGFRKLCHPFSVFYSSSYSFSSQVLQASERRGKGGQVPISPRKDWEKRHYFCCEGTSSWSVMLFISVSAALFLVLVARVLLIHSCFPACAIHTPVTYSQQCLLLDC